VLLRLTRVVGTDAGVALLALLRPVKQGAPVRSSGSLTSSETESRRVGWGLKPPNVRYVANCVSTVAVTIAIRCALSR
jgi:hypothetical protein